MNKPSLAAIGLMSGTSMDGIDAALIYTDGQKNIVTAAHHFLKYNEYFILELRNAEILARAAEKDVTSFSVVEQSTKIHAQAVLDLLEKANLSVNDVDIIGYHGQSLYHNPTKQITIQMGSGQLLADLTGIKVINDFRVTDIKNGGQGAPLAPIYHHALALNASYIPTVIVNCGGIANITIITGNDINQICGFDSGPGNVLLDRFIRKKTDNKELIDLDGRYGLKGNVNITILSKLMDIISSHIKKPSPKSLDPGELHLITELDTLTIEDACATLAAFTAKSIVESVNVAIDKWVLCGGGWNNPAIVKYLMQYLKEKNPLVDVKNANEINWSNDYMEAELFAYLAVRNLYNLPTSLASVTGAKNNNVGGKLYVPNAS
jgi:anhydro-N-acetylmuramic acid kinase